MEFLFYAIALVVMTPLALLPFITSAHDSMEIDERKRSAEARGRMRTMLQPVPVRENTISKAA